MTARRRPRMRRLVDNTVTLVVTGELSADVAAQKLLESGVPVAVIGRVLSDAATRCTPGAPGAALPSPNAHAAERRRLSRVQPLEAKNTSISLAVPGLA